MRASVAYRSSNPGWSPFNLEKKGNQNGEGLTDGAGADTAHGVSVRAGL